MTASGAAIGEGMLPLPFVLISVGAFFMGVLGLIFRWPTIS
jgi:hypothetical protein